MLDKLFSLFPTYQKRISELEKEVKVLNEKLQQRQEDINKTNAYWKKRLHTLTRSKSQEKS